MLAVRSRAREIGPNPLAHSTRSVAALSPTTRWGAAGSPAAPLRVRRFGLLRRRLTLACSGCPCAIMAMLAARRCGAIVPASESAQNTNSSCGVAHYRRTRCCVGHHGWLATLTQPARSEALGTARALERVAAQHRQSGMHSARGRRRRECQGGTRGTRACCIALSAPKTRVGCSTVHAVERVDRRHDLQCPRAWRRRDRLRLHKHELGTTHSTTGKGKGTSRRVRPLAGTRCE
jgi:hypothetical protein